MMLSLEEIRLKAEALERSAAEVGGENAALCLETAMQWRMLAVQETLMEAMNSYLKAQGI